MRIRAMCTPLCVVRWFARGAKPRESIVGQGRKQGRHETLAARSPVLPSLALYPNQRAPAAAGDNRKKIVAHRCAGGKPDGAAPRGCQAFPVEERPSLGL